MFRQQFRQAKVQNLGLTAFGHKDVGLSFDRMSGSSGATGAAKK